MKLKHSIALFGGIAVIAALLTGAIGVFSQRVTQDALNTQTVATVAVRAQMEVDMMHDALRGDILNLLRSKSERDAKAVSQAAQNLADHAKNMRDAYASLSGLALDGAVRDRVRQDSPLVEQYVKEALVLGEALQRDPVAARATLPGFMHTFEQMEGSLAKLGDEIQSGMLGVATEKHGRADRMFWVQMAVQGLMALMVLIMAYRLMVHVMRQLGADPQEASLLSKEVSAGRLDFQLQIAEPHPTSLMASLLEMQKQLQQRAAKAHEYESRMEAISRSQAIIEFDLDGTIVHANENFLKIMGYSLDELRGKNHRMFVDPGQAGSGDYAAFWEKLANGAYEAGQYRRLAKNGREVWLDASYNPLVGADGKLLRITQYATDVTDRQRIADENLRVRTALDGVAGNVMIADRDRRIVYMNKSVSMMMRAAENDIRKQLPGFDAQKLLGESIDRFHQNPDRQAGMLDRLTEVHRAQIALGGRTFSLIASPIFNAQGERVASAVEWIDRTNEVAVEKEVGEVVKAAAEGDFRRRVSTSGKDGFFALLAESINRLLDTSEKGLNALGRVLAALAQGDLTQRMDGEFGGTFAKLRDDADASCQQLTQIVVQIQQATDTINTAAKEIASGNNDLSARTEQQAASLEETASSMEEMTSTVKQNAENARQANQLAAGASDVARKGGQVVTEVIRTMVAIQDASKKISDIIGVIDGIAFQTNILALNAAVEAARAGEQGRGFAVVASEVRNLAQRSAAAAKEIKTLITDSVQKVEGGSKLVQQAGQTMDEIVGSVKRVTDIMSEISAASQEQSQGIEQINQTVSQMDEVTQQNAALVEQASAAARALEGQAVGLSESVSRFRVNHGAVEPTSGPAAETLTRPAVDADHESSRTLAVKDKFARTTHARKVKVGSDEEGRWTEF